MAHQFFHLLVKARKGITFFLVSLAFLNMSLAEDGKKPALGQQKETNGEPSAPGAAPPLGESAPPAEPPQAPPGAEPKPFQDLKFTGFVDVYATYNFNRPASGKNALHNFDFNSDQFSLNMVEFAIEKPADPLGFRADIGFGDTMDWIHSADPSASQTLRHLQQAYLSFKPPKTENLTIDVGKFVTQHGAEVIETKDNWNYSRGLLFGWAIPYYHFGARLRYDFTDSTFVGFTAVNGWNNVADNNDGKTFGFQVGFQPVEKVSVIQNYMVGAEQAGDDSPQRQLFDTVVTIQANDRLSFLLNYDYGRDAVGEESVYWHGVAGYVRYVLTPRVALITRAEWLSDPFGFATGAAQRLKEVTATFETTIYENLVSRLEYRVDWSDEKFFEVRDRLADSRFQNGLIGGLYVFF